MKTHTLLILLLFIINKPVLGQNESSILWEIEKEGRVSYVLGIYCSTCKQEILDICPLDSVLQFVNLSVFEYSIFDQLFIFKANKESLNQHFDDYDEVFDKKQFRTLNRAVKFGNLPFDAPNLNKSIYEYDELHPIITMEILKSKSNSEFDRSNILNHIRFHVDSTTGLKDIFDYKEYLNFVKSKDINSAFNQFIDASNNHKANVAAYRRNKKLFQNEEIDEIEVSCDCLEQSNEAILDYLWIPRMKQIAKSNIGRTLFTFPVYVLGRSSGLLQRLKLDGYTVRPL